MAAKSKDLSPRELNTWAACAAVVFIGISLIFNVLFPNPSPTQYEAFKTVSCLAAGAFGLLVPGLLIVNIKGSLHWPMPASKFAITGTSGAAFFLITYFFTPAHPVVEGPRIRVTVFAPTGMPVTKPEVWSSLGTVSKDSDGRCVIAIPLMANIKDTLVTVSAKDPETLSTGKTDIKLSGNAVEDVRIQLEKPKDGIAKGSVQDDSGQALGGARVYVHGHSSEFVKTDQNGEFTVPAHAANDESVRLSISKNGYETENPDVQVGTLDPVTITLSRSAK